MCRPEPHAAISCTACAGLTVHADCIIAVPSDSHGFRLLFACTLQTMRSVARASLPPSHHQPRVAPSRIRITSIVSLYHLPSDTQVAGPHAEPMCGSWRRSLRRTLALLPLCLLPSISRICARVGRHTRCPSTFRRPLSPCRPPWRRSPRPH